jgi:hypothetical protein
VIYQTGYSQFFDAYTDQCDSTSFLPYDGLNLGPKITKDLRQKLNQFTHEVNYVLAFWIDILNVQNSQAPTQNQLFTSAINFADVDLLYYIHRFCRDGVTEPDRNNPDTWFFHLLGRQGEGRDDNPASSTADSVTTDMNKYYDNSTADLATAPPWVVKTFHPTSNGMAATSLYMIYPKLRYREAVQMTVGQTFDILVMGDIVPYASQDPASPIYQGFIPHLRSIFRDLRYYGLPFGAGTASLTFLGSQQPDYLGAERHECYPGATIDILHTYFRNSPDSHLQNKVVILQAGTTDLLYDVDVLHAAQRIYRLIRTIFSRDRNAVVLLGHIPMIGLGGDGSTWYPLQRRVVAYNAHLSAVVDMMLSQGYRIIRVHTSATPLEHGDGDFLLPNTRGYLRMAYDFAEAIVFANAAGWLHQEAGLTISIARNESETGKVVCMQDRSGYVGLGEPSSTDIMNSILRGKTEDDFVNNVACNRTEICKMSTDGFVSSLVNFDVPENGF